MGVAYWRPGESGPKKVDGGIVTRTAGCDGWFYAGFKKKGNEWVFVYGDWWSRKPEKANKHNRYRVKP